MIIHPASADKDKQMVLNLCSRFEGSILIWFGLTWSLELYQQTNARLWRQGQQSRTVIIQHIGVRYSFRKDTIDERILNVLKHKDGTQAALIDAVKAELGMTETEKHGAVRHNRLLETGNRREAYGSKSVPGTGTEYQYPDRQQTGTGICFSTAAAGHQGVIEALSILVILFLQPPKAGNRSCFHFLTMFGFGWKKPSPGMMDMEHEVDEDIDHLVINSGVFLMLKADIILNGYQFAGWMLLDFEQWFLSSWN